MKLHNYGLLFADGGSTKCWGRATTVEHPLMTTSLYNGHFFWGGEGDSPNILSCFNLSTMTTFFCPLGGHCREHDPELLGTQKELSRCSVLWLIILYTMSVSVFLGNSHLVYAIIRKRNIFHQVSSLSVYWGWDCGRWGETLVVARSKV